MKLLHVNGTSVEKTKAEKAEDISKEIYNVKFVLTLAVLCDVYRIFAQISVLLQVRLFQKI